MNIKLRLSLLLVLLSTANFVRSQDSTGGFYTSFDGLKMYYEDHGAGFPVVLVHGFTGTGESWKRGALYHDLLKEGFRVIIFDMRGNGKSDKPHDSASYAADAEAKDIMGLVNNLKISNYNVLGYSRGSIITSRLLILDKRVSRGVMGGMGADFTNPEWPRRIMFYHALRGDSVPELAVMVKSVKDRGLDVTAQAFLQQSQPSTSKDALSKIAKPVLVICGDKDGDNGSAKELAALLPKSKYVEVPGNHGSAAGTPEFSKEVIGFFKDK